MSVGDTGAPMIQIVLLEVINNNICVVTMCVEVMKVVVHSQEHSPKQECSVSPINI